MANHSLLTVVTTTMALTLSGAAFAAGSHDGGHHGASIGTPGKAGNVDRTISITMKDNYYSPEKLTIGQGDTIRFNVSNKGSQVHEFNIGTASMHHAHQEEMMMMVEHGVIQGDTLNRDKMSMDMGGQSMKHDDPNSVLLEPGESREVIWHFSESTDLEFACNVPGHYQSGMHGTIQL